MDTKAFSFELDSITASEKLFSASRDEIIEEIGKKMTTCLDVQRVNIWMFDDGGQSLDCIGSYDAKNKSFEKGEKLRMADVPQYYARLKTARTLLIEDIHISQAAAEIKDLYCIPKGITALMDLPIRMEGALVGVMCYEYTRGPRAWTDSEIQFALAVNQVVALALETRKRRAMQIDLMKAVKTKDLLLKEMHHRIKNNLSILISLLRLQSDESGLPEVEQNLAEAQKRIFSMAKIHEQLYQTGNYLKVNLADYLEELVEEYRKSVDDEMPTRFETDLISIETDTSVAINLGLISIEVLNNAVKHAFSARSGENRVKIILGRFRDRNRLVISDNGSGINGNTPDNSRSIGMSIVEDLVQQIGGAWNLTSNEHGTKVSVMF